MSNPFVCETGDIYTMLITQERMYVGVCTAKDAVKKLVRRGRKDLKNPAVLAVDRHDNSVCWEDWVENQSIHHDKQPYMRSVDKLFAVPTILLCSDAMFYKINKKKRITRSFLYNYFKKTCQICENVYSIKQMSIEHIHPRSLGGDNSPENLTLTCKKCNSRKGSQTPYFSKSGRELKGVNIYSSNRQSSDIRREEWRRYLA